MEWFEQAAWALLELIANGVAYVGEICDWFITVLVIAALEGGHLTPGGNDGAAKEMEATVASFQQDRPPTNAWPEFEKLCESFGKTSHEVYEAELERVNAQRKSTTWRCSNFSQVSLMSRPTRWQTRTQHRRSGSSPFEWYELAASREFLLLRRNSPRGCGSFGPRHPEY